MYYLKLTASMLVLLGFSWIAQTAIYELFGLLASIAAGAVIGGMAWMIWNTIVEDEKYHHVSQNFYDGTGVGFLKYQLSDAKT